MIIADDKLDPLEAPLLERGEESSPVDLCFVKCGTNAGDEVFAALINADGDKDSTVDEAATLTDYFVSGIKEEVGVGAKGRVRHASRSASNSAAQRLTCLELTEVPQSVSTMAATSRVETPWMYIPAK